jgi:hypothetical protein
MTDPPSNSFAPDRDGLVGHDLRPHSQAVCRRRINRHAKIWCVAAFRGHLANHHRCMTDRESIRLHDHRRSRLAIVARRSNRNHVAALHPRSNSDTASIHPNAASSCAGSNPATSLATRRRIAFDRASGTTRRNSRKPRACRRSRMARIRSAADIVFSSLIVTRDSVTRYVQGSNDALRETSSMRGRSQDAAHRCPRAGGG